MPDNNIISSLTLDQLADRIVQVDETLRQQTAHAVNCMLTARNWFIGFYIVEFEQHGADRAQYGEQLLKTLAKRLNRKGITWRRLYEYRTFYNVYPQLHGESLRYLQSQMQRPTDIPVKKLQPLAAIFQNVESQDIQILRPLTAISPELPSEDTIRQYLIDNMPDQKEFEDHAAESFDEQPLS